MTPVRPPAAGQRCRRARAADPGERRAAVLAERAGEKGSVGALRLTDDLLQRDAIEREFLGVRLDPNFRRRPADEIGAADAIDEVFAVEVFAAPPAPEAFR